MSSEWDSHPNARHIDRILMSCYINTSHWKWNEDADLNEVFYTYCRESNQAPEHLRIRRAIQDELHRVLSNSYINNRTLRAVTAATVCLVEDYDCAYMLDSDPDELRLLAKLGDRKAMLMLPACLALSNKSLA